MLYSWYPSPDQKAYGLGSGRCFFAPLFFVLAEGKFIQRNRKQPSESFWLFRRNPAKVHIWQRYHAVSLSLSLALSLSLSRTLSRSRVLILSIYMSIGSEFGLHFKKKLADNNVRQYFVYTGIWPKISLVEILIKNIKRIFFKCLLEFGTLSYSNIIELSQSIYNNRQVDYVCIIICLDHFLS